MNIIFTEHAKIRMWQREITEEDISSVIEKPDIVEDSFKTRIKVRKKLSKGTLETIYKKSVDSIIIITCYWTKGE